MWTIAERRHALRSIGDLCLKKNSKAEAVDAYKRAADLLAEDGFLSKAIALYKKVLNIDPDKVEVHLALGDMNAKKGLHRERPRKLQEGR